MVPTLHGFPPVFVAFAACVGHGHSDHELSVRKLLDASIADMPSRDSIETFPSGAFGVVARTDRKPHPLPSLMRSADGSVLAVAGLPTISRPLDVADQLRKALDGDRETAIRILSEFDGAFFAALYHAASATMIAVGDFFGALPVYVARDARGLAISTRMRALTASGVVPLSPDPAGWGGFIGAKHFIGDDTSIAGVHQHPAGTILIYDLRSGRSETRTYWRWPETDRTVTLGHVDTGEVLDTITESVSRYLALGAPSVLPLSGGFESRLLAGILAQAGDRPLALTLPNPYEHGEIEARFAKDAARALKLPFACAAPPAAFFQTRAYTEYIRESEIANTSINLPIAQLDRELLSREASACWDGVMYGLVMKDFSEPDREALIGEYLAPEGASWQAARRVFAPAFADAMREALTATVAREAARYADSPEGSAAFFNSNRARRRAMPNPLKIFGRHALPFMPGLTRHCVATLWRIPVRQKTNEALYRRVLERHFPSLARIPYCSHGHLLPGTGHRLRHRLLACRSAVVQHPRVGEWLRRARVLADDAIEPPVVAKALDRIDLDAPHLNADGVRRLKAEGANRNPIHALAREQAFYWHAWTRVMRGEPLDA